MVLSAIYIFRWRRVNEIWKWSQRFGCLVLDKNVETTKKIDEDFMLHAW